MKKKALPKGPYTMILVRARGKTVKQDIVVTEVKGENIEFKIGKERCAYYMNAKLDLPKRLLFPGHKLGLKVSAKKRPYQPSPCIQLVTNTPDELRAFILENAIRLTVMAKARVHWSDESDYDQTDKPLFLPARTLHGLPLYDEQEIVTGIYFALDPEGHGHLHDSSYYVGLSEPKYPKEDALFQVTIFSRYGRSGSYFCRNRYRSQEAANKGLRDHCIRLFGAPTPSNKKR